MLALNKVYCGDCLELFKEIRDNSADLVFADPPYNISKQKGLGWAFSKHTPMQEAWDRFSKDEFFDFNQKWLKESYRVLKPGGSLFVCGSYHNIYQLGFIIENMDFKKLNSIVWFKPNAQPNITCRMFTESTEQLIWAAKNHKGWKFNYKKMKELGNGKQMRNVWEIPLTPPSEKWAGEHPTQKPEALLERVILAATDENDLVLDPFAGSGTTCVVAVRLGRNFLGFELSKEYCKIAEKRLEKERDKLKQQKLFAVSH